MGKSHGPAGYAGLAQETVLGRTYGLAMLAWLVSLTAIVRLA